MAVDDDPAYLKNNSYAQHMLITVGGIFVLVLLVVVMFIEYRRLDDIDENRKALLLALGIVLPLVILLPGLAYFAVQLRHIPTHLDITLKRVRIRFSGGDEVFGTEEVACFVGSYERSLFTSNVRGIMLKDGSQIRIFQMDTEFVEDLLALSKRLRIPLVKDWDEAQRLFESGG